MGSFLTKLSQAGSLREKAHKDQISVPCTDHCNSSTQCHHSGKHALLVRFISVILAKNIRKLEQHLWYFILFKIKYHGCPKCPLF